MDLQVGVEKVLDPFLPKVPGVTPDHYGHATKLGGIKDPRQRLTPRKE